MTNETQNTETQVQETAETQSVSFEEQLVAILGRPANEEKGIEAIEGMVVVVEPATETSPAVLDWKDGVTREKVRTALGYSENQDTNLTQRLGTLRDFLKSQSMTIKRGDTVMPGQKFQKEKGLARTKFVTYVKDQLKLTPEKRDFELVRDGIEIPKFRERATSQPDALNLLDDLIGDIS